MKASWGNSVCNAITFSVVSSSVLTFPNSRTHPRRENGQFALQAGGDKGPHISSYLIPLLGKSCCQSLDPYLKQTAAVLDRDMSLVLPWISTQEKALSALTR